VRPARDQRHQDGGGEERRPGAPLDQPAAQRDAGGRADEHRELLRAGRRGAVVRAVRLDDERPVGGGHGVQPDVADERGGGQDGVRRADPERRREQATGRDDAAAQDERAGAAMATAVDAVAPDADHQRDREPGRHIHEHDEADEARGVVDPLERHR
jgi:hypothetical protein